MALALSSTAIGLQMLDERNDIQAPYGERSFAVLLFQDLSVVPILAILPVLARRRGGPRERLDRRPPDRFCYRDRGDRRRDPGRSLGLNPFFRVLARSGAREVMTASALLVVLGAAL